MKNILIIEDDYAVRTSIRDLLQESGYKVFCAAEGSTGLELVNEMHLDLIICDIMMPDLDGYSVKRELAKSVRTATIPFIFLTALTDIHDLRKGMESGADDYLFKPFKAIDLLKAIELRISKFEKISHQTLETQNSEDADKQERRFLESERIFITTGNKPRFVKISDIIFITAESEYSNIHTVHGEIPLIRKLLKEWEVVLPENTFARIHRSTIINMNYIEKVEKWFSRSYQVRLMHVAEPLIISQRYAARIKTRI
ncbi:MAG: LytR/AlgR family response regulator transcription factor [Methanococcaceae archaeon]